MTITDYLPSKRTRVATLLVVAAGILGYHYSVKAGPDNGFDISNSIIPVDEILHGGPPRDGIPALSDPTMINASAADFLRGGDRVIGIEVNGDARAYPIGILNWHEIVNDRVGDRAVAITYCPLCGTGVAFDATINGQETEFGVSGLLYNSDVLLYDRNSESLWSQIKRQAISGVRVGQKLNSLPIQHTTWEHWLEQYPDTLVLSDDTGYSRNYARNPYAGYEKSRATYFAVNHKAPETYHPKEEVLGIEVDGEFKAYPFVELDKFGKTGSPTDSMASNMKCTGMPKVAVPVSPRSAATAYPSRFRVSGLPGLHFTLRPKSSLPTSRKSEPTAVARWPDSLRIQAAGLRSMPTE